MNVYRNRVRLKFTLLFLLLVGLSVYLSLTVAVFFSSSLIQYAAAVFFVLISSFLFYRFTPIHINRNENHDNQNTKFLSKLSEEVYDYDLLNAITNNITSSVLILDQKHSNYAIVYLNQAFTHLTGYEFEEMIGRDCSILNGSETDKETVESCRKAMRNGDSMNAELLNYRKDGTPFWNEIKLNPLHNNNGEVIYYVVFFDDITERKTYEKLIQESEQRYKSLFENNPEIVCSFDSTGRMTGANPAVEKITGYKVQDVLGKTYDELKVTDLSGSLEKNIEYAFRGQPRTGQVSIQHKDGHFLEMEIIMVPIHAGQEIGGFYVIAKDLTEYREAQDMLRQTEKLNVVGELAAGIAHEIRNPLTSLKGFIQLLQPSITSKKEYTEVMLSELNRIERIVSELLLLAKPKSAEFQESDLKTLLEHVRTLLNTKAIMSNTNIALSYNANTFRIYCEENQLKQVFINLLKNAIEAMESGGVIHIEAEETDCDYIVVRIRDEGEGIPEEHLERLGEPFYTTKDDGTGLGLMISSNIIKDHGGTIRFKNNEDVGATVEVTLPISVDDHRRRNKKPTNTTVISNQA